MKKVSLLLCVIVAISFVCCRKSKIERKACIGKSYYEYNGVIDGNNNRHLPNIFTPNGDGINDIFYARFINVNDFHFIIKTSLGKKIFETSDVNTGWDGTYKGEIQDGIFKFEITATFITGGEADVKGEVTCLPYDSGNEYLLKNCEDCIFASQFDSSGFNPSLPTGEGNICK